MTQGRNTSEGDAEGCTDGVAAGVRAKRMGRRVLTRFLPGSVAVVAAFTIPEFSVGAGDLAGNAGFDDPPEPAARNGATPGQGPVKLGQTPVKLGLAGVRYAPILELALEDDADAGLIAPAPFSAPAAVPAVASVSRTEPVSVLTESAPVVAADTPAFVQPPATPVAAMVAGRASDLPEVATAASLPVELVAAVAAVPQAAPVMAPANLPAAQKAPSLPRSQSVEAAAMAPPAVPARSAPVSAPAPAPIPALAAAPAPVVQAQPAGRGAIEQLTPARIAAARTAPPPPAARPAPSPAPQPLAATPVAAKVAVAAPGLRTPASAPVAPPVPAARPVQAQPAVAKPVAAKPVAASAPVPAAAAAVPKPRPANPALAAPAASKPAMPEITSRLLTRVDGKTAGAVEFQQTPTGLKVRLGSIVEVLADRYDAAQLARIRTSAAGNAYLSLAELQAQGVPISYDPVYDEFNVGLTDTRPKAARKVHMDQISAPERGIGATGMDQVRR